MFWVRRFLVVFFIKWRSCRFFSTLMHVKCAYTIHTNCYQKYIFLLRRVYSKLKFINFNLKATDKREVLWSDSGLFIQSRLFIVIKVFQNFRKNLWISFYLCWKVFGFHFIFIYQNLCTNAVRVDVFTKAIKSACIL